MKRLNWFLMATVVAFASVFTSCSDDKLTTVNITLESAVITSGASVTGQITALDKLETVTLLNAKGSTVTNWPVTSFKSLPIIKTDVDGVYTILIPNLADGSYTLRATDKSAVESNVTFTVGSVGTLKTLTSATTIYCTLSDGSSNSTCASADGTTYAALSATATQQADIDFVYFNASGNALAIYAPSAVPSALTRAFSSWTVKNATRFAKTTSISFTNTTYADVKAAADAASVTSTTALAANDVVVFKTAAGKVGIFKVNSITSGFLATDNVKINIKVQQ